ncbi:GNAT family N-acetyltransferase [Labrys wisconsinensis]|uniref:Ribosomal protein S18 acetylase RimI-like enzyme n=1 Tax=Labrys wisconsinensis TaxID=425677 RepID=A0ABU0JAG1_9HYPH|nr:GNAT family N-acetyltransferase [Labrys wisconsinensis]MDQ0471251.1 ribosomal protein S18 acetylase RimI-like enzyme [Labrys wisconsinensis]
MIRLAEPEDVPTIETLVCEAFALYLPRMDRPPGPMLDDYAAHVAAGRASVLTRHGRIAGVLILAPEDDHLLLDTVAVSPRFQGKGIGRALVAHAETEARRLGLPEVRLYTNEVMTENLPLYRHLGFVETHRAAENGYRRVFMTKRL